MSTKKKPAKQAWTEPRLSPEKIAELAFGIFQGEIFISAMIRQADLHLLPCIFLPFSFLSEKQLVELRRHPPSLFYGHYKNAAPRSINGYPFLLEMGMVYEQDAKLLERKFKAVVAATQEALKA